MTDHDRKAARREIADALLKALERRHEVADVVVESENKVTAVEAIVQLLDTSHLAAEAVMSMSFDRLTIDSRKQILAELEDLNKQLSFTLGERPASSGDTLELLPFSADEDRDIFATRTSDVGAAGDGSGGPAGSLDDEIGAALARVDDEEAAWFVAVDSGEKVGMVFGELVNGEVEDMWETLSRKPASQLDNDDHRHLLDLHQSQPRHRLSAPCRPPPRADRDPGRRPDHRARRVRLHATDQRRRGAGDRVFPAAAGLLCGGHLW